MSDDREHIIQMNLSDRVELRAWLERPNGSYGNGDIRFEAVEGGGILVRTQPFSVRHARQKARIAAAAKYCKDSPTQEHNSVQAINGDTNKPMNFHMCGYCGRRDPT